MTDQQRKQPIIVGKDVSCPHKAFTKGEVIDAFRKGNNMHVVIEYKCGLCKKSWKNTHIGPYEKEVPGD